MKKLLGLLFLFLFLLGACNTHQPYPPSLLKADSLASACPDSARSLLASLQDEMSSAPEAIRMYYRLLCIKADDKAYIPHTSDSLIRSVLHYYIEKGDKRHLPEAYYYAGRTYSDLKDAPHALEYYQQAIDAMQREKLTDYNLLSRTYSQMGELFFYQELYDEVQGVLRKAYQCDLILKDSVNLVFDLRDIGRSFAVEEQQDSAVWYYNRAIEMAQLIKDVELCNMVYREFAGFNVKWGNYSDAYEMLQIGKTTIDSIGLPPYYNNMARYYYFTNQLDSAAYYYQKKLAFNSLLHRSGAYEGLANIAHRQGDDSNAWHLLKQHILYKDSLQNIIRTEAINKINALYNLKNWNMKIVY